MDDIVGFRRILRGGRSLGIGAGQQTSFLLGREGKKEPLSLKLG